LWEANAAAQTMVSAASNDTKLMIASGFMPEGQEREYLRQQNRDNLLHQLQSITPWDEILVTNHSIPQGGDQTVIILEKENPDIENNPWIEEGYLSWVVERSNYTTLVLHYWDDQDKLTLVLTENNNQNQTQ